MNRFTILDLKLNLLRCFMHGASMQHRINILGRPTMRGALEHQMGAEFTPSERSLAAKALNQLENDELVRATYRDAIEPENWLELTQAGAAALKRGAIDDLDAALASIDHHFVEMRHGAWAALESSQPDSIRQAAHSARELFTQILDKEAPGVQGRRNQIRTVMQKKHSRVSDTELAVIETQAAAAEALQKSLHAVAHARVSVSHLQQRVAEVLRAFETALIYLLQLS